MDAADFSTMTVSAPYPVPAIAITSSPAFGQGLPYDFKTGAGILLPDFFEIDHLHFHLSHTPLNLLKCPSFPLKVIV